MVKDEWQRILLRLMRLQVPIGFGQSRVEYQMKVVLSSQPAGMGTCRRNTSRGPLHEHIFFFIGCHFEPSGCCRTRDEVGRVYEFSTRPGFNGKCDHEVLRNTRTAIAHPGIKPVVDAFHRPMVYFSCVVLVAPLYSAPLGKSKNASKRLSWAKNPMSATLDCSIFMMFA